MSRLLVTEHCGRISPVFDVATNLVVVNCGAGEAAPRESVELRSTDAVLRVREICGLGPDVLICGAISRPLEEALLAKGITVFSFICGQVDEVIQAFLDGRLENPAFSMPGCCGRRLNFGTNGSGCGRRNRRRHRGGRRASTCGSA